VIAVSEADAAFLRATFGVPANKLRVVRNGVPLDGYGMERAEARRACGLPAEGFLVGYLGALEDKKGVADLLRAADSAGVRGLRVALAGEGSLRPGLAARADGLVLGPLADPRPFLRSLDVFAFPSHQEALPLAVLEAMAPAFPGGDAGGRDPGGGGGRGDRAPRAAPRPRAPRLGAAAPGGGPGAGAPPGTGRPRPRLPGLLPPTAWWSRRSRCTGSTMLSRNLCYRTFRRIGEFHGTAARDFPKVEPTGKPVREDFLVFGSPALEEARSRRSWPRCARAGSERGRRWRASRRTSGATSDRRTPWRSTPARRPCTCPMIAAGVGPRATR
jgi:hypothetical protein